MMRLTQLTTVVVLAALLTGCAASRAFQRGEERGREGDWDSAVVHLREAVQHDPERAEYRIALERAMLAASREHLAVARQLEENDQLDAALLEWRRASEYDPQNRLAAAKVIELDRLVRERIEASRPRPAIEQFREQARQEAAEPILNPASRDPLVIRFTDAAITDILDAIGDLTGINITYDNSFSDESYTVALDGVTLEQGLRQILSANNLFYKVQDERTIIVIPDTPANRARYEDQVIQTFYVSNADATELVQTLTNITRIAQLPVPPVIVPNRTQNTITIRATTAMAAIIEQVIRANDKPAAEVVIDVEILEVNRQRAKQYGLDLSSYSLQGIFSPEAAPGTSTTGGPTTEPFNLNTISQGVSTADFYLAVPSAVMRFLETDSTTRVLAKPQLRGAEGARLTLNLGEEIPVVSTAYTPIATGGAGINPLTSFSYRSVGINLDITPRVTYEGDIVLELTVESSTRGADVSVAETTVPSFGSRRVTTKLRLRDGESNLLAGLLREDERRSLSGLPGLVRVPGLRSLFAANDNAIQQTDIVMLLTPRIIRSHELTQADLSPIFIGSQGNLGLTGPPPLIAAPPVDPPAAPAPETGAGQPPGPVAPPGSTTIPGTVAPPVEPAQPAPAAAAPPAVDGGAQVLVSPSAPELSVAGGPYPIPISISGVSRLSTISVTMTFNPQVLRIRTIQEGSFLRQGGVNATFTQQLDETTGRLDLTISRTGDAVGAAGTGLLAVVLFDATAPGTSTFSVNGVATDPAGVQIPLTFSPASVVVR